MFAQGLAELGWTVGRNVRIEYRWGAGDLDRFRRYAAELVALSPDVVLASSGSIVGAFQQASRTVPIVFVTTIDPVGGGWVESLSRPGQRHRICRLRIQPERQMAGTAQGDRARRKASGGHSRSLGARRFRWACCDSNRGAFVGC